MSFFLLFFIQILLLGKLVIETGHRIKQFYDLKWWIEDLEGMSDLCMYKVEFYSPIVLYFQIIGMS